MHRYCYVFENDPDPGDDAFFAALDQAFTDLGALGFDFVFDSEDAFSDQSHQLVWEEEDERATATVIKEGDSGLCYLVLTVGRRADAREILHVLEHALAFEALERLESEASRRMLFQPIWLVKLAIAAGPRPESNVLNIIRQGLSHRGVNVRFHAALAAAHGRWPALIPDLEQMLKGEPDKKVRGMARQALELCVEVKERRMRARRG